MKDEDIFKDMYSQVNIIESFVYGGFGGRRRGGGKWHWCYVASNISVLEIIHLQAHIYDITDVCIPVRQHRTNQLHLNHNLYNTEIYKW